VSTSPRKAPRHGSARQGPVFLAPLRIEAIAARRGATGALVERIGMGPVRATAARSRLERSLAPGRPAILIGVAGALAAGLVPGEVVVASSLLASSASETVELAHSGEIAAILEQAGLRVRLAPVVSSPAIVSGAAARAELALLGALAVDMESYWCGPLVKSRPFAVVRVVVDIPGRELWSPSTAGAGLRAYRSIVKSARALERWAPVSVNGSPLLEVGDL
jgi:4-hydroxy-3-methylbut-2-enyl diphosphate reductase